MFSPAEVDMATNIPSEDIHQISQFHSMKPMVITARTLSIIVLILASKLVTGCTEYDVPGAEGIEVGAIVALKDYALVCDQPSEDLNAIARSNGRDLKNISERIAHRRGCYDAASYFEKREWQVLAVNDSQLLIKMPSYAGEYWVSSSHVTLGRLPAIRADRIASQANW